MEDSFLKPEHVPFQYKTLQGLPLHLGSLTNPSTSMRFCLPSLTTPVLSQVLSEAKRFVLRVFALTAGLLSPHLHLVSSLAHHLYVSTNITQGHSGWPLISGPTYFTHGPSPNLQSSRLFSVHLCCFVFWGFFGCCFLSAYTPLKTTAL